MTITASGSAEADPVLVRPTLRAVPDQRPARSSIPAPRRDRPLVTPVDGPTQDDVVRDLVASQELERRRIARDLHDVVGQALTAVKLSLDAVRRETGGARAVDVELRQAVQVVDQAMRDVRDIAFDLRPAILDDLGLVAATRWYLGRQARIAGYRSTLRAGRLAREVDIEVGSACFRTLQEALTNVARHARATRVAVELRDLGDELVLVIEDDGVGFDLRRTGPGRQKRASLGLLGASERVALVGGSLDITSGPGQGTRIRARFPHRATGLGGGPGR